MSELTIPLSQALDAPVDLTAGMEVIERLTVGQDLATIERFPHLPAKETFLLWLVKEPQLALAYAKAREISAYALEEEALSLLRQLKGQPLTPAQAKGMDMLVQQLRWSAEKRNPGVFSKQAAVAVQIPIQINTSLDLGEQGPGAGTAEFPNIYELKADAIQVVDIPEEGEPAKPRKIIDPEKLLEKRRRRAATVARWKAKTNGHRKKEVPSGSDAQD